MSSSVLRHEPPFRGRLRFDLMGTGTVTRDLPWQPGDGWRQWSDLDDIRLASWCQERCLFVRPTTCAEAVAAVAADDTFHPVRDWLAGLVWDGENRIGGWLTSYLGVERSAYSRAAGRAWLVSAVARVHRPGCKADCVLVLEGAQGSFKSRAAAIMAIRPEWFADEIADVGGKDAAQDLRGKWVIEIAELAAMRRSEIERIKSFVSRSCDHYRPSYGRRSVDFPRQCVFIGTTNADAYLDDPTGARRFWPMRVGKIKIEKLRHDMGQLWAEAVAAFKAGERWHLQGKAETQAKEEQADRREQDPVGGEDTRVGRGAAPAHPHRRRPGAARHQD